MTTDLDRFVEAFGSENDLRMAVAKLLRKMPGVQGVQITHGAQEYGKDVIFYSPDAFGDWILNACVIKNGQIRGSADSNAGARTVFHQAEQALDSPVLNNSGETERIGRVYIISPYDCPQTTIRSIQGRLENRTGQIVFMCGAHLLEKFVKFWPEFLVFESTLLGTYVAALEKAFEQCDPMTFLAAQHHILSSPIKNLRNVYVPQQFHVALQKVELLEIAIPDLATSLKHTITRTSLSDIVDSIGLLARFVAHPQVWEPENAETAAQTSTALTDLARGLLPLWDENWKQRNTLQAETVLVRLEKAHATRLTNLVNIAENTLASFAKLVAQANDFVAKTLDILPSLGSKEHRNYCRVQEVVRLMPTTFKQNEVQCAPLPENLLSLSSKPLMITAPPGHGKTSFCKWNVLSDISLLGDGTLNVIPVYVPLHQLATTPVTNVEEVFFRTPEIYQLVASRQSAHRPVRVYLDGLDEVTTVDQQRKLMELAAEMASRYTGLQIVVTSRDYVAGEWLRWMARISLSELSDKGASQLLGKGKLRFFRLFCSAMIGGERRCPSMLRCQVARTKWKDG